MGLDTAEAGVHGTGPLPESDVQVKLGPGEVFIDLNCDQGRHAKCVGKNCKCGCHPVHGQEVEIPDRMTSHLSSMEARH